jgi:thiosulfate/3-mercaptopyruvate sulfurtransferase
MTAYDTYLSCEDAAQHLTNPDWVFVDCRYALMDKAQGRREYLAGHVAGAVFADMDRDLARPHIAGVTGRHPLPEKAAWVETIRCLGISNRTQVVAYDSQSGQSAAGRLWWMLKWAGHAPVAVIDGGFARWQALGLPVATGEQHRASGTFEAAFDDSLQVSGDEVARIAADPGYVLLDSRAADRYRGENEIIDPIAGHIPGALSAPFAENLAADGTLKPADELAARLDALAGGAPPERTVFYCGSGVSATQNLLAYAHVRSALPRLYVGSWSEWITRK